ncbi:hypothetical protein FVER53590_10167 [Fusarium verticillioides]|nr:hypothetical protein FVER53590_10167 [Fusarium verticillioides]
MTLGPDNAPSHHLQHEEEDAMPDHIDVELLDHIGSEPSEKRLIIAVDFGTTYSSVSYVEIPEGCPSDIVDPRSICSIRNYPETLDFNVKDSMLVEVPSEVIYPLNRHFREQDSLIRSQEGLEPAPSDSDGQETHHDPPNNGVQDFGIHDDEGDTTMNIDIGDQFYWGYKVHELWALPATHSDPSNLPLSRFKLLLDDSPMTERVRQDLNLTLSTLKSGGTVDANTYRVSNAEPLRLEQEIVQPGGGLHGSSYLNEDFKAYLLNLLAGETYLEQGSETINGAAEL